MSIIDFHAHILPGLDHGCSSLEVALRQLEQAHHAGVDTVVATSHFYPHRHSVIEFLEEREASVKQLPTGYSGIRILPAAEVLLCINIDHMDGIEKLCVQDTNVMLAELPFEPWSDAMDETIERLQKEKKLQIVIAHPERYDKDIVAHLIDRKIMFQVNCTAFTRLFKRFMSKRWLESGYIYALGSDIHGDNSMAYHHFRRLPGILKSDFDRIMKRTEALLQVTHCEE